MGDDQTLRVWDLTVTHMVRLRMLPTLGKSCGYSPDGGLIAVGLANGAWLVVGAQELETRARGHTRKEMIGDIKFSPCGRKLAVSSHDNVIDVYETQQYTRIAECKGHSSYITHIDWAAGARQSDVLRSTCGAYELLYFDVSDQGRGRQIPYASSLKDLEWSTQSCIFGWQVMGIWPEGWDGTDINACARSHTKHARRAGEEPWRQYLVTADDYGTVRLFHYPVIKRRAKFAEYARQAVGQGASSGTLDSRLATTPLPFCCGTCPGIGATRPT